MPGYDKERQTFLLLRYVLIIAAAYLFLFEGETSAPGVSVALVAGALLSNVFVAHFPENILLHPLTLGLIVCSDITWIALGLWYKGSFGSDVFFLYFFILFLAAIGQNLILIVTASVLLSGVDLILFVIPAGEAQSVWSSPSLVRVPFMFIAALFYGHLAEKVRQEKRTAENRLQALREIDRAITSTLDLRPVLDVLLEKIDLFLPYAAVTVRLLNKETGELEPIACRNINEEEWRATTAGVGGGFRRMLAENNAPLMVRNAQTDPWSLASEFLRKEGLVSYLRVPLIAKGEALGVLTFFTREEHEFSKDEVDLLITLAAQAAIAIHNARLYKETRDQAVELAKANKAKDEFLSVISHELRTPLSVVLGYSGLLKDGVFGEINLEQEGVLQKILGQLKSQLDMVNDILQVSQIEAGRGRVRSVEVNLGDILKELKSAHDIPGDKKPTFNWDYPANLPVIKTDSEKLKHVLQNLINNAIKFAEKGEITVSARYLREASEVQLKVSDTGIGIPKEKIPLIFDMFRQIDSSQTRVYGGVGLGLYIVRKFTDLLGGRVEVESEPNKGSTFTVTLPC